VSAQVAAISSRSSYVDILNEAWAQHLAPREPNAPTVISTFAGAGGSSLGYSMAGYRELLAVEWDNNAVETFRLNFPGVPVYHGDIANLSVDEVLQRTGLQPGELDVFDGSPPCQGFSTAGKRLIDDPRNQLFRQYVRLLQGLQPRVFVMENVSGMVKGKMKLVFAEILKELKAAGYRVSARLLNAMYFHVPQSRERMIFIGVREDLGREPSHPKAQSRIVTIKNALPWVAALYHDSMGLEGKRIFQVDKEPVSTIRVAKGGAQTRFVAQTIDNKTRRLTVADVRRLASFPDEFHLAGTFREAWSRIGNSVPPLFMRAIARHIREHLL
jgi:DNA (cytosine-5)-methyltransferase 1